eukprot:IDg15404t1
MRYIGKFKMPQSFRNYLNMKEKYSSQRSGWMDTKGFVNWIHWWYEEVKKVSVRPWSLLMDNFEAVRSGPHIEDEDTILSLLLRETIEILL